MPTADKLAVRRFGVTDIPDLAGKTVAITGSNNGLGLQSATALARAGARVILLCRNQETGRAALAKVRAISPDGADHQLVRLDLTSLAAVRDAADSTKALAPRLDVLINNAGLMAVPFDRTDDGFEKQIGTNHFGHFVLTDALLPSLLATNQPRVVTLASVAHKRGAIVLDDLNYHQRPYTRMGAYSQSKLANLIYAAELGRRSAAAGSSLISVAAHPGIAATNLFDSMVPPIPGALTVTHLGLRAIGNNERGGALSQLYAATMPDVRNGDYLGPNQLGGARGPVRRSKRTRSARDETVAAGLWDKSVELTGADYSALASTVAE
ncbi:oxidoreductase [Antrihabitans cavernicola]|uniref:SDR family NAD(P)-dependent oxidoreductase n=1 Tax=Antrihabitans cavernicola TaxID=2495913 RepID=A0A5A7S9Y2_9NOCA|nr:oxidoreductase [Spelaeibacter cavernicola]KAA0022294.1 SDR family NAD(P)-dependent oxidoreductase [Spelaeibacter cavernicola]